MHDANIGRLTIRARQLRGALLLLGVLGIGLPAQAGLEWIVAAFPAQAFPYATNLQWDGAFAALDNACRIQDGSPSLYTGAITADPAATFPARKAGWCLVNAPFIGPIEAGYYSAQLFCNAESRGNFDTSPCPDPDPISPAPNLGNPAHCGDSPNGAGNPIHVGTGNKFQAETDYVGSGPFPLRFVRYYNSHDDETLTVSLGARWRHAYESRLHLLSATEIVIERPDGARHRWTDSGGWSSTTDRRASLTPVAGEWHYVNAADSTEVYDANGVLQSIIRRDGFSQTFTYDGNDRLWKIVDPFGRQLELVYQSPTAERLAGFIDPAGNPYGFLYDANGNLQLVDYPGVTGHREYRYEDPVDVHRLTGITDENGDNYATWAYGASGEANLSRHGANADRHDIRYNPGLGQTTVTLQLDADPLRTQTLTYHHTTVDGLYKVTQIDGGPCASCGGDLASATYDVNGFRRSWTDYNQNETRYEHDTRGLEQCRMEAWGTAQLRRIETHYLPGTRLPEVTTIAVPSGVSPNLSPVSCADPSAGWVAIKVTTLGYTADRLPFRQLATRTVTDPETAESRITTYAYYPSGLLQTVDGPRNDVLDQSFYEYDGVAHDAPTPVHPQGLLTRVVNALGHATQYADHDAHGRARHITDPNGLVTQLTYHPRGWLETQTLDGHLTTYGYYDTGDPSSVDLPAGGDLSYQYDAAHRLTDITDAAGNTIRYTLDGVGNHEVEDTTDPASLVKRTVQRVYDALNRLDALTNPVDDRLETTHYGYDGNGNRTSELDPRMLQTLWGYDALDRLSSQLDPNQGLVDYGYDGLDNLVRVTDANRNTTLYDYNAFGDKTHQDSPDSGVSDYEYDLGGNLKNRSDARGAITEYGYDALNRRTSELWVIGGRSVVFRYDEGLNGIGRLTSIDDDAGRSEYRYDVRGNRIGESRFAGTLETRIAYGYDGNDQLISITYPSGRIVHYDRNALGQVETVRLDGGGAIQLLAKNLTYRPFGPLEQLDYGNGLQLRRDYDPGYRLTAQTVEDPLAIPVAPVLGAGLSHDPVGNILHWQDTLATERTQDFTYDVVDRIRTADGTYGSLVFTHDDNGNRALLNEGLRQTDYTVELGSNRILDWTDGTDTVVLAHDAAGNLKNDGTRFFDYDDLNRLVQFTAPGVAATYHYDGFGQRVRKDVNGLITRFRYGPDGALLGEYDAAGAPLREYVYLDGQPLALLTTAATGQRVEIGGNVRDGRNIGALNPIWAVAGTSDFNGDGKNDILLRKVDTGFLHIYQMDGNVRTGFNVGALNPIWTIAGIGDFGGDGKADILLRHSETGQLYMYQMNGHVRTGLNVGALNPVWNVASIGDFNGDGKADILLRHSETGQLYMYQMNGNVRTGLNVGALNPIWTIAGIGDFGGDGKADILLRHSTTGQLYIYQMDGSVRTGSNLGALNPVWNVPGIGDLGGDGRADLVLRHSETGQLYLYEINSTLGAHVYYTHTDHLGAVVRITDEAQQVAWDADRRPFGALDILTQQIEMPLRFPGQYHDQESGLYYNYYRYYDPSTGRYITSDPIGLAGGLNTYGYVGGNPLSYSDPLGLFQWHGNWCGPDWTGGHEKPWNELTPDEWRKVKGPIDELDRCCVVHDKAYADCRDKYPCDPEERAACFKSADRQLYRCSRDNPIGDSGQAGLREWMRRSNPGAGPNCARCTNQP